MKEYKMIEYNEKFGPIECPEGFLDELKGLTLEEMVSRYRWVWGKHTKEEYPTYIENLKNKVYVPDEKCVIVKDGIVIGFKYYSSELYPSDRYILPYQSIYFDCGDNNGAGYKESEDYRCLICW